MTLPVYWHFERAIPESVCDFIIDSSLKKIKEEAVTVGENFRDESLRKTEVAWVWETWILGIMKYHSELANRNSGWNYDTEPTTTENAQFALYKSGYHYQWHRDNLDLNEQNQRKLTAILHLNDPIEYSGGELSILSGIDKEGKAIEHVVTELNSKGSVIVFPSNLYHKVNYVQEGERMTLVYWSYGPNLK